MAYEDLNMHVHDAGFLRFDWMYATDKSVDDAIGELNSHGKEWSGITTDHVMAFIKSAADVDQITIREARKQVGVLHALIPEMTLEAKRLVDAYTRRIQDLIPGIHDDDDELYSDQTHPWIGTGIRIGAGDALFSGDEMNRLLQDMDNMAQSHKKIVDGIDWSDLLGKLAIFTPG